MVVEVPPENKRTHDGPPLQCPRCLAEGEYYKVISHDGAGVYPKYYTAECKECGLEVY